MTKNHYLLLAAQLEAAAKAIRNLCACLDELPDPVDFSEPIRSLRLSVRTERALANRTPQIRTIGELVSMTEMDLCERRGIGEFSLQEVRETLALRNLKLKGET